MNLATGGFTVSKLTISQILQMLSNEPRLLTEKFFKEQEYGHPLTIGWNKIEFYRDLCRCARLIRSGQFSGDYKLTKLGEIIVEHDPDLADLTTWWIIHTNLASDQDTIVYYALFSRLPVQLLNQKEVVGEMVTILGRIVSEATVKKDAEAMLRWFTEPPFANLGTLVTDGQNWSRRSPSPLPSPYVIAYALINFNQLSKTGSASTRLSPMLKGGGSLGAIFGIREDTLKVLLRQAESMLGSKVLSISDTAGMDTIFFGNTESWQIVEQYYLNHAKRVGQGS